MLRGRRRRRGRGPVLEQPAGATTGLYGRLRGSTPLLMTGRIGRGGREGQTHTAPPELRLYSWSFVWVVIGPRAAFVALNGGRAL